MAAPAAHILRMGSPLSCAGRVRQWLNAVPAARVWAACQSLPLTGYDATSCHGVQEAEVVKAGHAASRESRHYPPTREAAHPLRDSLS